MSKRAKPTFECPNCGSQVVVGRASCRDCGSDASTGWQSPEEIDYQSIDIPDGYGPENELDVSSGSARWVPLVALMLVIVLLVAFVFARYGLGF